jgi:hypothetical protein
MAKIQFFPLIIKKLIKTKSVKFKSQQNYKVI